jgi:hypothetical protein
MEKIDPNEHTSDLSLVGFEKVFVQIKHPVNNEQISKHQNIHEHVHDLDAESHELVTMAEASRRFKMPYPTLRRQVVSGKIPSIPGPDGKPLVKMMASELPKNVRDHKLNKTEQKVQETDYSVTVQRLLEQMQVERSYSKVLNEKLEAANHRNGYLEAQVEQQKEQIKLITDNQRNRSNWWQNFCLWFTGAKHS